MVFFVDGDDLFVAVNRVFKSNDRVKFFSLFGCGRFRVAGFDQAVCDAETEICVGKIGIEFDCLIENINRTVGLAFVQKCSAVRKCLICIGVLLALVTRNLVCICAA